MKTEKITFKNSVDENLAGVIHIPKGEGTFPSIIMIHGLGGTKDEWGQFTRMAKEFCKNNYLVLRFDCAGSGESEGKFRDMTRKKESGDTKAAIKFLKSKKKVDKKRIALLGLSLGAAVSVLTWTPEIKTMVLLSSAIVGNVLRERYEKDKKRMKQIAEKGYFVNERYWGNIEISKELFYEADTLDLKPIMKKITAPVLLIHGTKDVVVPVTYAKEAVNYFQNAKLEIIGGADHNYRIQKHEHRMIELSLDWFKEYLK